MNLCNFMDKPTKNDIMGVGNPKGFRDECVAKTDRVRTMSALRKCRRKKMKKDNRQVMNALVLVFQFGINMIVPIFLCCMVGIWIGNKTGISWMMIPFFFIGALAGFNNIYKMARKLIDKDSRDDKHVKKDQ